MKENNNSYSEYLNRIESEEVKIMRAVLDHIEDKGDYEFEDSSAHNAIIGYFNKNRFHRKMTSEEFDRWKLEETYKDEWLTYYDKYKEYKNGIDKNDNTYLLPFSLAVFTDMRESGIELKNIPIGKERE